MIVPPKVEDDEVLYARRALSLNWTSGQRELCISGAAAARAGHRLRTGRLGHRKDPTRRRQEGRCGGARLAAVGCRRARRTRPALQGKRRWPTTKPHHADRAPQRRRAARARRRWTDRAETAERLTCDARRLYIKRKGRDLVHSRVGRCASYAQMRALHKRSGHCQYPGCTAVRELEGHHILADECGGLTELDNLILLCPRHHKLLHDRHIRTSGRGEDPVFADETGRAITTNQPHAPPG